MEELLKIVNSIAGLGEIVTRTRGLVSVDYDIITGLFKVHVTYDFFHSLFKVWNVRDEEHNNCYSYYVVLNGVEVFAWINGNTNEITDHDIPRENEEVA